jgi:predicted lipoprotein with Yx(FWY)xxD motif
MAAIAVVPLLAMLIAACGGGGGSSATVGTGADSDSAAGPPPGVVTIATSTGSGGTHLVSGSGRTIYLSDADKRSGSECTGTCAKNWPPVISTRAPIAGSGASAADLGTTTRSNGSKQVTYRGHPLYFFLGDQTPGAANGQGSKDFGARWWLVAPSGNALTSVAGSGSGSAGGSSSSAGGGWA